MSTTKLGLEPLIGVEELAEYLGVPVQTIYDWRLSGRAPRAYQFGKHLRFAVSDITEWLADPGDRFLKAGRRGGVKKEAHPAQCLPAH